MTLCVCGSDPQSRLVGREDQEDPLSFGKAIDMVDSYKRADMYQETRQQLQRTMDQLHERERRGERSLPAATYARNILWQVYLQAPACWPCESECGHDEFCLPQTMVVTLRSAVGLIRNPLSFYLQVSRNPASSLTSTRVSGCISPASTRVSGCNSLTSTRVSGCISSASTRVSGSNPVSLPDPQVAIMVLFGFIVGLVYFQLDKKKETESTLPNVINDRYPSHKA